MKLEDLPTEQYKALENIFSRIEEDKKKHIKLCLLLVAIVVVFTALSPFLFGYENGIFKTMSLVLGIGLFIVFGIFFEHPYNARIRVSATIKPVIKIAFPGISYSNKGHVSYADFLSSGLFNKKMQGINGEDLFDGEYKNCRFKFSQIEMNTLKKIAIESFREGKPTLDGIFFRIEVPKPFNFEGLFVSKGLSSFYEKKLDLETCSNSIYSDDCKQARHFFDVRSKQIKHIQNTWHSPIRLNVIGGYINLFIENDRDFFELAKGQNHRQNLETILIQISRCVETVELLVNNFVDSNNA